MKQVKANGYAAERQVDRLHRRRVMGTLRPSSDKAGGASIEQGSFAQGAQVKVRMQGSGSGPGLESSFRVRFQVGDQDKDESQYSTLTSMKDSTTEDSNSKRNMQLKMMRMTALQVSTTKEHRAGQTIHQ